MTGRAALSAVTAIAIGAAAVAWYYREQTVTLQAEAARNSESRPVAPSVQHELVLGPNERLRMIAIPSRLLRDQADECLLYTNDATGASQMRCRDWVGNWGQSSEH